MKKEIVAIDIHSHFNHGSPFDEHGRVPGFRHRASRM
jgi:hypothetical protein